MDRNAKKHSTPMSMLWGNTIGLSWMWGLGLFFSVQFTIQFGLVGLLCFAVPNALGLFLFGKITDRIAQKGEGGESLAKFYDKWSKPFRLPLFLYQIAALSLTLFAIIRYLWQPLGFEYNFIYLPLGVLVVLAAAFLFGEEFSIKRIKWSHSVMLMLALVAMLILVVVEKPALFAAGRAPLGEATSIGSLWGWIVPICVGLLVGPWMDLQHWQRAIEIRREGLSITKSYAFGSALFFGLLLFHGFFANWAMMAGAAEYVRTGWLDFQYGHQVMTEYFYAQLADKPIVFGAYATFICVCILTTLDSGYIALRWFFSTYFAGSNNMLLTLIPSKLLTSPIPSFIIATLIAAVALLCRLELEYFMIFYATFFVAYSTLGMLRTLRGKTGEDIPQVKMFCVGAISVVIFAFGYLREVPFFMACGSLVPLGYIIWLFLKSQTEGEAEEQLVTTQATTAAAAAQPVIEAIAKTQGLPEGAELALTGIAGPDGSVGYFEGNTFVHSFLSTYADTNSVGNIYFAMYAMWVGKTRELFFRKVLPEFDLETTEYYILTRSFEHKFVREAKEFEKIRIELSIGEYNRKFVELNHKVLDGTNKVLGKGKQSLMFVASEDYSLMDIPGQLMTAFIEYVDKPNPEVEVPS